MISDVYGFAQVGIGSPEVDLRVYLKSLSCGVTFVLVQSSDLIEWRALGKMSSQQDSFM